MAPPAVIALFGPTGVGKTEVAIALARRLRALGENPVAVSADALQVYDGLQILTGVADAAQQHQLEHRLVSFLPVDASFSAGQYAQLAHAEIDVLLAQGRRPIIVGGTGLYLRAALTELSLRPPPLDGVREHWTAELRARGPEALHAVLAQRAPGVAPTIAPTDSQRIVRALELIDSGELDPRDGAPDAAGGSETDAAGDAAPSELWTAETRHPTLLAGLVMERSALYARIDARVEAMVAAGAAEEVRTAAGRGAGASETARKALGFRELLDDDVDAMQRHTRNYARRQLTWMRKLAGVTVLDMTDRSADDVAEEIAARWQGQDRP
jgi:tRNA dimethylallyltransferase